MADSNTDSGWLLLTSASSFCIQEVWLERGARAHGIAHGIAPGIAPGIAARERLRLR
jgi:hypothetical protein